MKDYKLAVCGDVEANFLCVVKIPENIYISEGDYVKLTDCFGLHEVIEVSDCFDDAMERMILLSLDEYPLEKVFCLRWNASEKEGGAA